MSDRTIPVFYHVPKNAGTYVINCSLLFFREYRRTQTDWLQLNHETIKNIEIVNDGETVARLLAGDPDNTCFNDIMITNDMTDHSHHYINLYDVHRLLDSRLFIFLLVIEDAGFSLHDDIINKLQLQNNSTSWIVLREPFSRSVSWYNYVTSDKSSHEPYHDYIKTNFEEYIISDVFESNWVMRGLAGLNNGEDFTEQHCMSIFDRLDKFNVYDIAMTDVLIDCMFQASYNLSRDDFPDHFEPPAKHENRLKERIKFEDLESKIQQAFIERTYWDRKLWERYCKND